MSGRFVIKEDKHGKYFYDKELERYLSLPSVLAALDENEELREGILFTVDEKEVETVVDEYRKIDAENKKLTKENEELKKEKKEIELEFHKFIKIT